MRVDALGLAERLRVEEVDAKFECVRGARGVVCSCVEVLLRDSGDAATVDMVY